MTFLLDVNVLIALLDPDHVDNARATDWFERAGQFSWATSPIVENGIIRIVGAANYASIPLDCAEVANTLAEWCQADGHQFWPDDLSLLSDGLIDRLQLISPKRITDTYLLALAVRRAGKLATLDRRLSPEAVNGGREALHVIQ